LFIFDDRIESIDFGCSKCLLIARWTFLASVIWIE
jgi:hypothetical protein